MAFSVNQFRSQNFGADSRNFSKQSNYELIFTLPEKVLLSEASLATTPTLRFRTESAEIPGRSIITSDYKSTGYGLTSKVGYGVVYPDVTITMLCGADLGEKRLFNAWQSLVVGNHTRNKNIRNHQSIGYYSNYVSTLGIVQYDQEGNASYATSLMEAYPIIVNSMPLSWASEEMHRLTVQFTYKYFEESDEPEQGLGAQGGGARSGVEITGLPSIDNILAGAGLPPVGEVLGIPIFNSNSFTLF